MQIIIGNPNLTQKEIGAMVGMTATGICCVFQRVGAVFKKKNALQRSRPRDKRRVFRENIINISR
ncbi:hypothetical protein MIDIC_140030 [Alphaproteobacteria bacterium]